MKSLGSTVVMALAFQAMLVAQSTPSTSTGSQAGPDLSGRWNREAAGGSSAGSETSSWGSLVEISQSGPTVTVRSDDGKPQRYIANGTESAEVIEVKGCANKTRITKSVTKPDSVTITTWLVNKSGCWHGEFEDEPIVHQTGPIAVREIPGPRTLETITVVYREGDRLTVETTRRMADGTPATTTTTYRK